MTPPSSSPGALPASASAPSNLSRGTLVACGAVAAVLLTLGLAPHVHVEADALARMRTGMSPWAVTPFAALLLSIAVMPLVAPHWWEHNRNKGLVAALLAVPVAAWLLAAWGPAGAAELREKAHEYVSFLVLLGALYVISGGIFVRGSLDGTPALNTVLLGTGALLASLVGTTGASMLLIRPLLRANAPREQKAHVVVFFIFVVSNCGGLLTPLGDPPLFLGFLKGVPFGWTVQHLWLPWLVVNGALLAVFALVDKVVFEREEARRPGSQREEVTHHAPLGVDGAFNLLLLLGVVAVVAASGHGLLNAGQPWPFGVQEGLMAALALASWVLTPPRVHAENHFSLGPIVEVAVLFAGIFVTMIPALLLLNAHGASLGVREPWQFFWVTGLLSSFLDNAPTYMTMAAAASGLFQVPTEGRFLAHLLTRDGTATLLSAISAGAVLMGANTYIGNGPNFMVKAVAEQRGVKMPSFFGYMAWSAAVLVPLFAGLTWLLFLG